MDAIEPARSTAALRELPRYLRRPQLTAPLGIRDGGAWRQLLPLIGLELAVLLVVILPLAEGWKYLFHLPDPAAFDKLPHGWLVPLTVIAAPIGEEIAFRGWLTGRVRALWLLGCGLVFGALLYAGTHGLAPLAEGVLFLVLLLAAPVGWFVLRKRGTPVWFASGFPAIFYLVVIGFAVMHVTNYDRPSLLLLPLVLPQAWIGLMLGYTRMRLSLIRSILMHMTSNGIVLLVGLVAG